MDRVSAVDSRSANPAYRPVGYLLQT